MFFVSKKKYNALLEQKKDFERIALDALAQNGRLLSQVDDTIKEMEGIQELNHRIATHNNGLLARCKELETELERARQDNQRWSDDFEKLDIAYGQLEIERDRLSEERDRYKERVEAFEEGKYLTREAE